MKDVPMTNGRKIYTKTGDAGDTGLFGGPRVSKDHPRIEAYGTVDELNAAIGAVRSEVLPREIDALLGRIQNRLFDLGAVLATPAESAAATHIPAISPNEVATLEAAIDSWEMKLPLLKEFILPGGTRSAANLHSARCICRRAERRVVTLAALETVPEIAVVYLNRLSDLLFVLARAINQEAGVADVPWEKS